MATRVLKLGPGDLDGETEGLVREALAAGGVVAFPTESFYGLAVVAGAGAAVERLLDLKGDRGAKPIPLILAAAGDARRVARHLPPAFAVLAARFWPGPLTLVVPARADVAREVTAGTGTIGVRVPDHAVARAVARAGGGVVTATSANASGAPPPVRAADVVRAFAGRIELVLDGGETPGGLASTVLDLTRTPPAIVRAGPIDAAAIERALGAPLARA